MIELKTKSIVNTMKAACLCSLIGWGAMANAAESSVSVRHLANEQNIVFVIACKLLILVLGAMGIAGIWVAIFGDVGLCVLAVLNAMRALTWVKVKRGATIS